MSEYRFTDGNLIVLYMVHTGRNEDGSLPDYVMERVKVGLETHTIVMASRPDKHKTMVIIVADSDSAESGHVAPLRAFESPGEILLWAGGVECGVSGRIVRLLIDHETFRTRRHQAGIVGGFHRTDLDAEARHK